MPGIRFNKPRHPTAHGGTQPNLKVETLRLLEEGFFLPGKKEETLGLLAVVVLLSFVNAHFRSASMAPPLFSSLSKCVSGKKEEGGLTMCCLSMLLIELIE